METSLKVSNPWAGSPVFVREHTRSTWLTPEELALRGCAEGTVVVAGFQQKGRGRAPGRTWHSNPWESLMATIVLNQSSFDFPVTEPASARCRGGLSGGGGVRRQACHQAAQRSVGGGTEALRYPLRDMQPVRARRDWRELPADRLPGGARGHGLLHPPGHRSRREPFPSAAASPCAAQGDRHGPVLAGKAPGAPSYDRERIGQPFRRATFLRRRSGFTTTGCPTASRRGTSKMLSV